MIRRSARYPFRPSVRLAALCAFVSAFAPASVPAEPSIPYFWDAREQILKPDLTSVTRVRFLTTVDYPPFSYIDGNNRIGGFNVDLARAICSELAIAERCQIQGMPWPELGLALKSGNGEAIIAGLAVTARTREEYRFTRAYLSFPARFVVRKDAAVSTPVYSAVAGERIGVLEGSAHEDLLRDLYPEASPVTYSRAEWMYEDLREGNILAVFGDGMRLSFWISGTDSRDCCDFVGGPILAPEYFGPGMAIALAPENEILADAFDYALKELTTKGVFAELYLRYFPTGFF